MYAPTFRSRFADNRHDGGLTENWHALAIAAPDHVSAQAEYPSVIAV